MDVCAAEESDREAGESGEHLVLVKTTPNALLEGQLSILCPYACVLRGGVLGPWIIDWKINGMQLTPRDEHGEN